jgi:hypothetical protein
MDRAARIGLAYPARIGPRAARLRYLEVWLPGLDVLLNSDLLKQ